MGKGYLASARNSATSSPRAQLQGPLKAEEPQFPEAGASQAHAKPLNRLSGRLSPARGRGQCAFHPPPGCLPEGSCRPQPQSLISLPSSPPQHSWGAGAQEGLRERGGFLAQRTLGKPPASKVRRCLTHLLSPHFLETHSAGLCEGHGPRPLGAHTWQPLPSPPLWLLSLGDQAAPHSLWTSISPSKT